MKVVNSAVAGSADQAADLMKKWKKRYTRVTRVKHKTTDVLRQKSPGRYGPFWYEVKGWQ